MSNITFKDFEALRPFFKKEVCLKDIWYSDNTKDKLQSYVNSGDLVIPIDADIRQSNISEFITPLTPKEENEKDK